MTKEQIKARILAKHPTAIFNNMQSSIAHYSSNISEGEIFFDIPYSEMDNYAFTRLMPAELLTDWITEIISKK